jgi:hypothetical protein
MKQIYLNFKLLGSALLLAASGIAQTCFNGGTGANGAFNATSNTTLAGGVYNFTTFNINTSVTVNVTGSVPLEVHCTGAVTINGILAANGGNGTNGITFSAAGTGGIGVAGGGNGGNGTYSTSLGAMQASPGAGSGGVGNEGNQWSGGGGAGYSATGQSSGNPSGGFGGPSYGSTAIAPFVAGSGGGGGSGGFSCGSGGGGAGGGAIMIQSSASIAIGSGGAIRCNGGDGGSDGAGNCGGGGGGSGGSIRLGAPTVVNSGAVSATGGIGGASMVPGSPYFGVGGNGAAGRVRVDGSYSGNGTVNPGYVPGPVLTATSTSTSTSCSNSTNGTATVVPQNGSAPYTFAWSNSATTATATNLTAGTYSVTVTDAAGCTATSTIVVTSPSAITATAVAQPVSCFAGCNGNATVSPSGGTPGYTYSWAPSGGTGSTATGLCAGTYTCTITDANGCTFTTSATVTEPAALVPSVTSANTTCNQSCDGSAAANPSGGTAPYTYAWTPGNQTTAAITGLCSGTYSVAITDAAGCTVTDTVSITSPSPVVVTANGNGMICSGDTAVIFAIGSGGAGSYTYNWNPGNLTGSQIVVTPSTLTIYTVTVTDASGCVGSQVHTVMVNPLPVVNANGPTQLCVTDGVITYSGVPSGGTWSGPAMNNGVFSPSTAGVGAHTLVYSFTDSSGCSDTAQVIVTVDPCTNVSGINATTAVSLFPNPNNGTFTLTFENYAGDAVVEVMDVQGKLVQTKLLQNVQAQVNQPLQLNSLNEGMYLVRLLYGNQIELIKIQITK